MHKLTLFIVVLLAGCGPMSYDEVKSAEKWCADRGLGVAYGGWKNRLNKLATVTSISCVDKDGHVFTPGG